MEIRYAVPDDSFPPPIRLAPPVSEADLAASRGKPPPALPLHCKPWQDAYAHGFLLPFPYRVRLRVLGTAQGPRFEFAGGHAVRRKFGTVVSAFSDRHFGLAMQYRFRTEAPHGLYIGPVPHAHADMPPLPLVCGFIESWWYPRPLFLVFGAPREGEGFTLTYGQPLCHVLAVRAGSETLRHMDQDEIADEVRREQTYQAYLEAHPHLRWRSADGAGFSRLYKRFSARARRGDPLG